MAILAAINSATPSLQSVLIRSRVEQARREADRAEAYAQTLRQQADEQERVGQQARGRAQTLEKNIPTPAAAAQKTSAGDMQTLPKEPDPTYLNALGETFRIAKPVLALDLSATQKNVVKSSLFDAADKQWSADQSAAKLTRSYRSQSNAALPSTTGRLLNTAV